MPRTLSLSVACAAALILAGCDRESTTTAQPQESSVAEKAGAEAEQLTGTVDRSFAGQPIPDFTVTDPQGNTLALKGTQGTPVLLNLWATWCAPCVIEMPMLDELAGELDGSVKVLTVSEDMASAEGKVVAFFAEKKFSHLPQWLDQNNDLAVAFGGGAALPLTVLYDAQGKEVWRIMGGYDWTGATARELVAEATAGGG